MASEYKYARVEEHPTLIRDMHSKAVLQTDPAIVRKHEKHMYDLQKEETRQEEINSLKTNVREIKDMLKVLFEKVNNNG